MLQCETPFRADPLDFRGCLMLHTDQSPRVFSFSAVLGKRGTSFEGECRGD